MSEPRTRLSYLFLDVFLGSFIIAIVLMVTLGKPSETSVKVGAGTPRFVRIEVSWMPSSIELIPRLIFEHGGVGSSGTVSRILILPANPLAPDGIGPWPKFDYTTGKISRVENVPYKSLFMSGFTLGHVPLKLIIDPKKRITSQEASTSDNEACLQPGWRVATLWIIDPMPGNWQIAVSPQKTDVSEMNVNNHVNYCISIEGQGYEEEHHDITSKRTTAKNKTWSEFVLDSYRDDKNISVGFVVPEAKD